MVIESFTTARAYGVEDAVIASLNETFPGIDWEKQGAYFFQRVIEHGRRRSEEVREVAETVREIGLDPVVGPRHGRAPGLDRRPGRRRPVRTEGRAGLCAQRRLAHRGRPHPGSMCRRVEVSSFTKTPGWLDWYAGPSKPRFKLPAGSVDAHCHVFGPGDEFPYAPERKYTPCDASQAAAVRAARPPRLRAQRGRAGHLPRRRQPRDGRCADRTADGKARGVATVKRSVSDAELQGHARGRRARRALQLRQAAGRLHAQGRADGDRRPHRPAGLARGDLLRGGRPARAVGLLHRAADHRGGRPHGPARREPAGRRARSSSCS